MKKCIKCRQQIPDDCEVCTYCGQWQEQIKEESFLKTTKQCVKCKQQIPIDCEECSYCGQTQPVENNAEQSNTFNAEQTEKEKRKKQWKNAGIVFGSGVLFFVVVLGFVSLSYPSTSKNKSHSSSSSYSYTEPTTVDNSVGGNGYYYFDNKLIEETVEKFNNVFYGDTGGILDISVDDFSYIGDVMLLDEKVSQYNYIDFNGKTGVFIFVNEDNQVSAFTFAYDTKMLSDPTTSAEYKNKQLVGRPASWIYALSDTLTYEKAYDIYNTLYTDKFLNEMVEANDEGRSPEFTFYYSGYTFIVSASTANKNQDNITILKTDSDFIDKNGIKSKKPIFSAIDTGTDENSAVSTTNGETTKETTLTEPATVSAEEIAEAENLLHQEPYGSDYLGPQFSDKLNVLDTINYYIEDNIEI